MLLQNCSTDSFVGVLREASRIRTLRRVPSTDGAGPVAPGNRFRGFESASPSTRTISIISVVLFVASKVRHTRKQVARFVPPASGAARLGHAAEGGVNTRHTIPPIAID